MNDKIKKFKMSSLVRQSVLSRSPGIMDALVRMSVTKNKSAKKMAVSFSLSDRAVKLVGWSEDTKLDLAVDGNSATLFPSPEGVRLSKSVKSNSTRRYIRFHVLEEHCPFKESKAKTCTGVEQESQMLAFDIPSAMIADDQDSLTDH